MDSYSKYAIDSGVGLKEFLERSGIRIAGCSGVEGAQNIIELPDLTCFNWKVRDRIVRVNCKENAMYIVEQKTNLKHVDNGVGDSTRPYSFLISSFSDLIDVVYALKQIEGNSIQE